MRNNGRLFTDVRFGRLFGTALILAVMTAGLAPAAPMNFPGKSPGGLGSLSSGRTGQEMSLGNAVISATWKVGGGALKPGVLTNKITGQTVALGDELFRVLLKDGRTIKASGLKLAGDLPRLEEIKADPKAPRLAEQYAGRQIVADFTDPQTGAAITWRAILRDQANNIRQQIELKPQGADVELGSVVLLDLDLPGARVSGTVKGSPIVTETLFLGFEEPMSSSTLAGNRATCALSVGVPIRKGQTAVYSSVLGVAPEGQMRRAFLYYIERERAHPYRTFLHYNTWYDLGYFSKYNEADAVATLETYGRELVQKRGVQMSSNLFDDGWDDTTTVWQFHSGFPKGFAPLRETALKYKMGLGVWMSPFGGYGTPHRQRVATGRTLGYEINRAGFQLSGPKYYEHFRATALKMVQDYGVNMFKFDGLSQGAAAPAGSAFSSDFQAAIQLIRDLRAVSNDIFINLTTGTWPSPFWTLLADSIWRDGEDHDFVKGPGSWRQRWTTYRDEQTYLNVYQAGPLYPLSSLMLHGLVYAKSAQHLNTDPQGDFKNEVRSYFGEGTQLQELYLSPGLLSPKDWDVLAEAANWSHRNADVLRDTHWVGGNPGKFEVYGWASWDSGRGILVLRNPSDKAQSIKVDARSAFELPAGAASQFALKSPYADQRLKALSLAGASPVEVTLEPFEVLVFEGLGY